ncbi:MAG: hypothetical protein ACM3O9_01015 [Methylocystaceae bacterium]
MPRVVEAYIGEYASGKSENAINRALELAGGELEVTLVDLDTVEPFYTLRPIKEQLEAMNIAVVGWSRSDVYGLGEAGSTMMPAARWVLMRPGHIIMDIGYGVQGARTLNLVEGANESSELRVLVVINTTRPMTTEVPDIIEYIRSLGRVDAIVNNTHLSDETTPELVATGLKKLKEVEAQLGLPIAFTVMDDRLREQITSPIWEGESIKFIKRYMPAAMW